MHLIHFFSFLQMDYCNRMWVLDTGKIGADTICPAKILLFDLVTNKLVAKMEIPNDIATGSNGRGLLITPILEIYGQSCEHATVSCFKSSKINDLILLTLDIIWLLYYRCT